MRSGPHLRLIALGRNPLSAQLLPLLAGALESRLRVPIEVGPPSDTTDPGSGKSAGAYPPDERSDSNLCTDLLAQMQSEAGGDGWMLGVTTDDLFAPTRRYVFGEAVFDGRCAVVSAARFGAIAATPSPRLLARLLKESLHELGHLAGLEHCATRDCLMSIARRVADIDRKKLDFCEECQRRIFPTSPLVPRNDAR